MVEFTGQYEPESHTAQVPPLELKYKPELHTMIPPVNVCEVEPAVQLAAWLHAN
jgi:hypothetical protein